MCACVCAQAHMCTCLQVNFDHWQLPGLVPTRQDFQKWIATACFENFIVSFAKMPDNSTVN